MLSFNRLDFRDVSQEISWLVNLTNICHFAFSWNFITNKGQIAYVQSPKLRFGGSYLMILG